MPELVSAFRSGGPVPWNAYGRDMIEAQAFAFLAVRVLRGRPTSCPGTTGVRAAVGGGTVSRPRAGGAFLPLGRAAG